VSELRILKSRCIESRVFARGSSAQSSGHVESWRTAQSFLESMLEDVELS